MAPSRIDNDIEITIPLTNRSSFQRNNITPSTALSSSQQPTDFVIIDDNNNTNARTLHSSPSSVNHGKRQLTIWQFVTTRLRFLWRLMLECLCSWLLLCHGTAWPMQWQKDRCAEFLADRPPPFQLLSSGEVVLDPSLNSPLESSQISST